MFNSCLLLSCVSKYISIASLRYLCATLQFNSFNTINCEYLLY